VAPRTRESVRVQTRETPDEIVVVTPPRPAGAPSPAPRRHAKVDSSCDGLEAYPWPRSYQQAIADARRGVRKPTAHIQAEMIIDPNGNITHLRFTRLSSLDNLNRLAYDDLKKRHYKPTVLDGEQICVYSTVDIGFDF
jgi:hypothetical protein